MRLRCTGCGNCCREPLLPITDVDLRRIVAHTAEDPRDCVAFVAPEGIEMDDEPEAFAVLRQGRRVMVLRHTRGKCRYLGGDERCQIYPRRPLGCVVFPFDPEPSRRGGLKRLRLIEATTCPFELDGRNEVATILARQARYDREVRAYRSKVAEWNLQQRERLSGGYQARTSGDFIRFLGFGAIAGLKSRARW